MLPNNAENVDNVPQNRKDFLLQMYAQLWGNINRHILIPWQSITIVIGTFALFSLVEKNVITLDIATSLIIVISAWQIAHVRDSSAWVNRNLAIIVNIERQFLNQEDSKLIHFYFLKPRKWELLENFKIQQGLGIGLATLIWIYHFYSRILPICVRSISFLEILPTVTAIVCLFVLLKLEKGHSKSYKMLREKSPGGEISS